jgi:nucleoside-diphosphate-sugar epimerase
LLRAIDRGWPLPLASIANRRSLIYVGNLVDAIRRCLEIPAVQTAGDAGAGAMAAPAVAADARTQTFELSDGAPVSTPELCRALARALNRPARLFPFPAALLRQVPGAARLVESQVADDSAIRGVLGWRPPFTFEQGLKATADWYRAQGG